MPCWNCQNSRCIPCPDPNAVLPPSKKPKKRLASLKSISSTLDLGDGLTLASYQQKAELLRSQLATYNESLSFVDRSLSTIQDTEQQIRDLSERMLIAVAARYGKDSYEYEMAGGTRKRERRRPRRRSRVESAM